MVSELGTKKVGDHFVGLEEKVTPSMTSYLKMGLNIIKMQEARLEGSSTTDLRKSKAKGCWLHL